MPPQRQSPQRRRVCPEVPQAGVRLFTSSQWTVEDAGRWLWQPGEELHAAAAFGDCLDA